MRSPFVLLVLFVLLERFVDRITENRECRCNHLWRETVGELVAHRRLPFTACTLSRLGVLDEKFLCEKQTHKTIDVGAVSLERGGELGRGEVVSVEGHVSDLLGHQVTR